MPLDRSISRVLVIGAGPIVIGQGCEFDYSGTQACKALREEGIEVVLLNSNPASVMTDRGGADAIYMEPMTLGTIAQLLRRHKIDAILPTVGGQTALNCAREAARGGLLRDYGVRLLGVSLEAIEKAEDRALFKEAMRSADVAVAPSRFAACWQQAEQALAEVGLPAVVRCSYALGGHGGGVASDEEGLRRLCEGAFERGHGVLIERYLTGWKEYELEVVKDRYGNAIVVCGIENVDSMGVHTGDSIAVSPIQTLSDKEYQAMRRGAFMALRAIGLSAGGCNVQFAVNPSSGQMFCVEANPRVSRSSALASKATGYPIARIAAKLALGYALHELRVGSLPASFEPVLDYVAVKAPHFDFDKFPGAERRLTTRMKSTGEVLALGRTFKEAWNKAVAGLVPPLGNHDVVGDAPPSSAWLQELALPLPGRLALAQHAMRHGVAMEEVQRLTGYDIWFLGQLDELAQQERQMAALSSLPMTPQQLRRWKRMGFSDAMIASLTRHGEEEVARWRRQWGIAPVYKKIDSCGGEFPNDISCYYSTYGEECEVALAQRPKVMVLGSGPNRIGQGIEFDHCCVHAVSAVKELGYEAVMVNSNPETVSTDYDVADRLYIEPMTCEHVLEVAQREAVDGILFQFGGQTSLHIARGLRGRGVALLGTPWQSIEMTEDRKLFRALALSMGLRQPRNGCFSTAEEALSLARELGYPLICRPSHVIGGASMRVVRDSGQLLAYFKEVSLFVAAPILLEEFLEGAMEVEVDAIADGEKVFVCGIVEHIEPAGVHSGDSRCYLSPRRLDTALQRRLVDYTGKLGRSLGVLGLYNVQYAVRGDDVMVIEANLRASRTVPLLTKTTGMPLAQMAAKCIMGMTLREQGCHGGQADAASLALKLPVFSCTTLGVAGHPLGPSMRSTGEVLCWGRSYEELEVKASAYAALHT